MPRFCAVFGCSNRSNRENDRKYFSFPGVRDRRGRTIPSGVNQRDAWINAIKRADLTVKKIKHASVCSDHFVTGKPALPEDTANRDYAPSQNMGYTLSLSSHKITVAAINRRHSHQHTTKKLLGEVVQNRWTVPQIEALIEQYKKYPVLYATNHERHTDRALKNECLRNIVSALETIRFGVTEADVVTQWNNLVLKYVQTPQVQEGTSSTGEERQVWYFQKLQFLEDHLNTSNIKLEEYGVETDQMEMFEPEITTQIDLENSTLDPLAASIKIEVEEPCLSEPTMKHENTAEMNGEDVKFKDENDIFGDFVAAQLKKITDDEVRQDAVFEIHKILHTALRKK